jgi:hypothetical protein
MATDRTDRVIQLLESIDAGIKVLVAGSKARLASAPKPIASDRDLDGKYGDPLVKLMPRDWSGPSFQGLKFSECPAELLDLIAEMQEYFAGQSDAKGEVTAKGKPVGDYRRADAARARGWAKRIRDGKHVPANPAVAASREPGDEDWPESSNDGWN